MLYVGQDEIHGECLARKRCPLALVSHFLTPFAPFRNFHYKGQRFSLARWWHAHMACDWCCFLSSTERVTWKTIFWPFFLLLSSKFSFLLVLAVAKSTTKINFPFKQLETSTKHLIATQEVSHPLHVLKFMSQSNFLCGITVLYYFVCFIRADFLASSRMIFIWFLVFTSHVCFSFSVECCVVLLI